MLACWAREDIMDSKFRQVLNTRQNDVGESAINIVGDFSIRTERGKKGPSNQIHPEIIDKYITASYWLCAPVVQLVHVVWHFPGRQLVSLLEHRISPGVKSPELVTAFATTAAVSLLLLF